MWLELIDTIDPTGAATLPTDAIKESFFLSFHWIEVGGCNDCLRQKRRYKLQVLGFVVTPSHVHLLVVDRDKSVIPNSLQFVAGENSAGVQ